MSIDDKFVELYGFTPEDYYRHAIRQGVSPHDVLKDIDEKIDSIWDCLKNQDGFFPVGDMEIPFPFI